jgi:hypothetical protein
MSQLILIAVSFGAEPSQILPLQGELIISPFAAAETVPGEVNLRFFFVIAEKWKTIARAK